MSDQPTLKAAGDSRPRTRQKPLIAAGAMVLLLFLVPILLSRRPPSTNAPSNGWILFEAEQAMPQPEGPSASDIYLVAEGVAPRRLIGMDGDATDQSCPAFSPDGSAFSYIDGGDLVIARLEEGGAVTEEARFARQLEPQGPCPRWSPDGSKIAFVVHGLTSLRILALGVGPDHASIFGPYTGSEIITGLAWSPDSATVGIANEDRILGDWIEGGRLVRLITGTRPGTDVQGLPSHDRFGSIAWSATTGLIAIAGSRVGPDGIPLGVGSEFLRVANAEGRSLRRLPAQPIQGPGYEIAWSPDGSTIGYVDAEAGLELIARDGSSVRAGFPLAPASGVVWSPDGRRMLHLVENPWRLMSVSVDRAQPPIELAEGDALGSTQPGRISWQPILP